MGILNYIHSISLSEKDFLKKIRYNKDGYYIHQKVRKKNIKVSIIIPVFNAENTLSKTIDSIITQSIGFNNLEIILIDDMSDDSSREILLDYAKKHPNISPVFLKENTGSPAIPRNLGIHLAKGEYITFIDSDDWFHKDGIRSLYRLLEITGDNYAIGKTIKVTDKGQSIVGEYNSCATRESVNPLSIDSIFHHLAPTGRMLRRSFLLKENITFPNLKFAEDKQFFLDVLTRISSISTSKDIIYYANRYSNNESLTTLTNVFEKTDANISVIKYVIKKNLPLATEKALLNRLYEFDCITRLFNRQHFLKSDNKHLYFKKFNEVLDTTKNLRYNFDDNFKHDWHNLLLDFFKKEDYSKITSLIKWSLNNRNKEIVIDDNLPYFKITIDSDDYLAKMDMYTEFVSSVTKNNRIIISCNIFGNSKDSLNSLVIRQRNNDLIEREFPITHRASNLYEVIIPFNEIENLNTSSYSMYIKFNNYKKSLIKMNTRDIIKYNNKQFDFYASVADNYGLNIK